MLSVSVLARSCQRGMIWFLWHVVESLWSPLLKLLPSVRLPDPPQTLGEASGA